MHQDVRTSFKQARKLAQSHKMKSLANSVHANAGVLRTSQKTSFVSSLPSLPVRGSMPARRAADNVVVASAKAGAKLEKLTVQVRINENATHQNPLYLIV